MDDKLQVLLNEYSQLRESERATRSLLYTINMFAATIVFGLLVAITTYKITILVLVGPLIFFCVGFFWHSEAIRLLKLSAYIKNIEREVRRMLAVPGNEMLPGFESVVQTGNGVMFLLRNNNIIVVTTIMYGIFYLIFFYLLATSTYSLSLRVWSITLYMFFTGSFWGFDLWTNRRYLLPKEGD
jgi:hypothetical protein